MDSLNLNIQHVKQQLVQFVTVLHQKLRLSLCKLAKQSGGCAAQKQFRAAEPSLRKLSV